MGFLSLSALTVGRVGHLVYALRLKEEKCKEVFPSRGMGKRGTGRKGSWSRTNTKVKQFIVEMGAGDRGSLYGPYVTRAPPARMVETGAAS